MRRELGFDFGKSDDAVVDGHPVLYDANCTPAQGDVSVEVLTRIIPELALGIAAYR